MNGVEAAGGGRGPLLSTCINNLIFMQRPAGEMTHVAGVRVAADGVACWNPAFDVTPAELITGGIVTETGVYRPDQLVAHAASA